MYGRVRRNEEEMGEGGSCMQLGRFAGSPPRYLPLSGNL